MRLTDFDFELPDDLIAQEPLKKRDQSRMLVLDRATGALRDQSFESFSSELRDGDVLIVNNTKVFPARLNGQTEHGGRIEVFLVEQVGTAKWSVLARPGKRLKPGKQVFFGDELVGEVVEKTAAGQIVFEFKYAGDFEEIIDRLGQTPLPPYIKRNPDDIDSDRDRYQTLYAKERGAIAAPTAGLHFTDSVMAEIRTKGIEVKEITLHVGYGTFEPVRVDEIKDHRVSTERFEIDPKTSEELWEAKEAGRRIVAVGTTTTRALESSFEPNKGFKTGKQETDLTILPGYEFKVVDSLLTNFHLPMSSLLVLVSTFAGHDNVMNAYQHAVRERYRFYSYGDCLFIG
jgi:S-adenosylmethionine:tRNA ribosyltransferase-isomerase